MHKPQTPHAWCDTLLVFCVTDDKAFDLTPTVSSSNPPNESTIRSIKSGMTASSSLDSADWQLLTHTEEIELSAGSVLRFDIDNTTRGPQSSGGISLAKDLQLE